MEEIFCPWQPAQYFIFSDNVPQILYYALIPGMVLMLMIGFLVVWSNKKNLQAWALLFMAICFFFWGLFALVLFATNDPVTVMLYWSYTILIELLMYASGLYLAYLFFDQKDISYKKKLSILLLLLPIILLLPTNLNIEGITVTDCSAIESFIALYYTYAVEIIYTIWIIIIALKKLRSKNNAEERQKIRLFTVGIIFFLIIFSSGNIIGSFTSNWVMSQYGYFGMPVFASFLAYLIVRYQAFNVKLLATQALIMGLIILISSEFFFIRSTANRILVSITLLLVIIFGLFLIRSVKNEVVQRKKLEKLSRKLQVANIELKRLDIAKSEFISIASHQLRTPLTAIKGFLSLVLEGSYGKISTAVAGALDKVYISNERLSQLVEDLLSVSRIESGKMEYKLTEEQIEGIIKEMGPTFEVPAHEKGITLVYKIPKQKTATVFIDRNKMREVVSNLIDNAIKYTTQGGTVTVTLTQKKDSLVISIKDTGMGMSRDTMNHIFEKFSRGKGSNVGHSQGTGLGLFVVKNLVEAQGGKIWTESKGEGKGATFFVEIPTKKTISELEDHVKRVQENQKVKFQGDHANTEQSYLEK